MSRYIDVEDSYHQEDGTLRLYLVEEDASFRASTGTRTTRSRTLAGPPPMASHTVSP